MDSELEGMFNEYRAVNNQEKEGDLEEIAQRIRAYQLDLLEREGHMGIGEK